jgi:ADP-ribosylglycohydrolase
MPLAGAAEPPRPLNIAAPVLEDKIRGGLLGEILGDLNGLKHEMKYIDEPGSVASYTPALPDGAWTDDDTDIEWIYVLKIQSSRELFLSASTIADEWRKHINRRFWCSHQYLRQLMDIGILPPYTGSAVFNPWADFNLSGQFVSETWGLIAPGMPRTAARLSAYYTHVSVDFEPVQSAQMFAAMIATAYITPDIDRILDAGAAAVDPKSVMRRIVSDVRAWHKQHPDDWRATRSLIKANYTYYGGHDERDRNGVIVNGASTIAALLYGKGDFAETVRHAFNFGWDCDNVAATSGTIIGVIKGAKWFHDQGWEIQDRFKNTSRDDVPENETISSFGDRMVDLMRQVIRAHGGKWSAKGVYEIHAEQPANVEALADRAAQRAELEARFTPDIERTLASSSSEAQSLARAAYTAICLEKASQFRSRYPDAWSRALAALNDYPKLLQVLFYQSSIPAGERIRELAVAAGVQKPGKAPVW